MQVEAVVVHRARPGVGDPREAERQHRVEEDRLHVVERLRLDGVDGEVGQQLVVGRRDRAAAVIHVLRAVEHAVRVLDRVHLRGMPDEVARRGPVGDRRRGADLRLVADRVDPRAVGERRHPAPQVEPGGQRHAVLAVLFVEPRHVPADGDQRGHGERDRDPPAAQRLPRPAAQQQEQRQDDAHDRAFGAGDRGVADEQPGDHGRHPGDLRLPQQQRDRDHQAEREHRLCHDQVLVLDDVPVEEHRQRRDRRPGLGYVAAAQQDVDQHRDGKAHQVLHRRDQRQRVEGQQQAQEERVARRLRQVRLRAQRGAEVHVGVPGEPEGTRVADRRQEPHQGAGRERPGEQLVLTGETTQARQDQSRIHVHDPIGAYHARWPSVRIGVISRPDSRLRPDAAGKRSPRAGPPIMITGSDANSLSSAGNSSLSPCSASRRFPPLPAAAGRFPDRGPSASNGAAEGPRGPETLQNLTANRGITGQIAVVAARFPVLTHDHG